MHDLDGRFSGSTLVELSALRGAAAASRGPDSRIAFLRVDQICDFEVQGQVRLVVLRIACIPCAISSIRQLFLVNATDQ